MVCDVWNLCHSYAFILVTSMEIRVIDIKIGVIAKKAWTYVKQGVTGLGFIMIKIDETGK